MNFIAVIRNIGYVMVVEGGMMLTALPFAIVNKENDCTVVLGVLAALLIIVGLLLTRLRREGSATFAREGFVIVAVSWLVISAFGALPFTLTGAIPSYLDALFETVSGFTTTGASILTNVEILPRSLLYWRSLTHWLGGMGVLVFMLAIVPQAKGDGNALFVLRAESPGPIVGKLSPKIRQSAQILYIIYIAMTLVEFILLLCGGMSFFDAITHSFATAGTGGFSTRNASVAAFDSVYIQTVIGVFMLLFGVNFNIYYFILLGRVRDIFKNSELKAYMITMLCSVGIITVNLLPMYKNGGRALLDAFFQTSSIMTTTGFATANFDLWPQLSRTVLVLLMIVGACAGSTGGGMKFSRIIIIAKAARQELLRLVHPRKVRNVNMDGKPVGEGVVHNTFAFSTIYFLIVVASVLVLSIDSFSVETNISAVLACLNNIGPGLGLVGPVGNYSSFSAVSKLVLTANMLLGRLEIFPMLILFSPSVWKRSRTI